MDVASFSETLRRLSADDIRRYAACLQRDEQCVADQVSQWRAELAIDRLIRRHCTRFEAQRATAAGQQATRLVVDVARQRGMSLPDGDVSRVARAAGQIARVLSLESHMASTLGMISSLRRLRSSSVFATGTSVNGGQRSGIVRPASL